MFILFDIGGTKMRIAGTKDGVSFQNVRIEETLKEDFDAGLSRFETIAREIAGDEKIQGLAGGIAGPLNKEKTELLNAPHIEGWIGKPLHERLHSLFNAPVLLENDAGLVGLGEALYGAGKGFQNVAYITVSTGVGGGRIINGVLEGGASSLEPGHQIIQYGSGDSSGGETGGDLESRISGTAIEKRTGKKPYEISVEDPLWGELARILAVGLHNVSVFWAPEVIVLGGSMIVGTPRIPLQEVETHLKTTMKIFPTIPELKQATLKDEGGLYGALALVKRHFLRI